MKKNPAQLHHQKTRICRDLYKPARFLDLVKSLFSIIVIGQSPITPGAYNKRKI